MTETTSHDRTLPPNARSLGPLIASIVRAEELSRDISAMQAALAPAPLSMALHRQAAQESNHVAIFRAAATFIPGDVPVPVAGALERYDARLRMDIARSDLTASLIGLQCVLEGFAAVALQPPSGAVAALADRLVPARAFVLHQECGHHSLGQRWITRMGESETASQALANYAELAQELEYAGLRSLECLQGCKRYYERAIGEYFAGLRLF